jgi:hypothetical protein
VLARTSLTYRDGLAFQVTSGVDSGASDEFDAANVAPRQDDERITRVKVKKIRRDERQANLDYA